MIDKTANAGSSAQNGFALQRNTALYLLIENYKTKFKGEKYFICLEHHEDFLFCFLNKKNEVKIIEAYQSKKKSPTIWRLNTELFKIISKILKVGQNLVLDKITKSSTYKHYLFFVSNQTINLEIKKTPVSIFESIKEDNTQVKYSDLHKEIKDKITKEIKDKTLHSELHNFGFIYVDLNRTASKQKNELIGQLYEVFGDSILNKQAAIETLFSLFQGIELTYNQRNTIKLLDESKRVNSEIIDKTFDILTNKSKCFNYWRSKEREISIALHIKPYESDKFQLDFTTAFDLFKSLKEAEHNKILNYVKNNYTKCTTYTLEDNVNELIIMHKKEENSIFTKLTFKAIFFAAYFEATFQQNN
ncbi:hypothetical protein [Tenacibaculum ovolyticum]|uniref:hypothetical protein n=1 Tax=Tenacibaculum ovolyticum TaxID=104270 RepID=UPI003BAC44BD